MQQESRDGQIMSLEAQLHNTEERAQALHSALQDEQRVHSEAQKALKEQLEEQRREWETRCADEAAQTRQHLEAERARVQVCGGGALAVGEAFCPRPVLRGLADRAGVHGTTKGATGDCRGPCHKRQDKMSPAVFGGQLLNCTGAAHS